MGLDIKAFRKLRKVEDAKFDKYGDLENYDTQWSPGGGMRWSESIWKGRGEPLNPDDVYEWNDSYEFRAGSYSSYGRWRDELEKFKGDVAFQELIDFADNEGVIGSKVSVKLLDDFYKYQDEAVEYAKTSEIGSYFIENYNDFMRAFELAANEGAVDFR